MTLSSAEVASIAPNLGADGRMYLLRPTPGFADPPICTLADLRSTYTIDDLADFHEILDLRNALDQKVADAREDKRRRQP